MQLKASSAGHSLPRVRFVLLLPFMRGGSMSAPMMAGCPQAAEQETRIPTSNAILKVLSFRCLELRKTHTPAYTRACATNPAGPIRKQFGGSVRPRHYLANCHPEPASGGRRISAAEHGKLVNCQSPPGRRLHLTGKHFGVIIPTPRQGGGGKDGAFA